MARNLEIVDHTVADCVRRIVRLIRATQARGLESTDDPLRDVFTNVPEYSGVD